MQAEMPEGGQRVLGPRWLFLACLVVAVGFVIGISVAWDRAARTYESYFDPVPGGTPPPETSGRVFLDGDAYFWIAHAREMVRTGAWRIRHTFMDNAPFGRPVHWNQSVSWMLLAAGWLRHVLAGEGWSEAIEKGALYAGPAQWILLLFALGLMLYRRVGAVPAGLAVLTLAGMQSLQWVFHPLRPDHHGLHIAFLLGSLSCLILGGLGWVSTRPATARNPAFFRPLEWPDAASARLYFGLSGFLGGLGLWTGATVQILGIGLVAVGALLLVFFMPPSLKKEGQDRAAYVPGLWRRWGVTGAATSLAFYALEYLPGHAAMRLEVNHPLYALTWFCVGEILARVSAWRLGLARLKRKDLWILGALVAGALALPVLLAAGPAEWHYLRQPWAWRMSRFIRETRPIREFPGQGVLATLLLQAGLLPLFLLAAPALAGPRHTRLYEWAVLWMSFLPPLAFLVAGVMQVRWLSMFCATSVWLMAVVLALAWRLSEARPALRSAVRAGLVLLALQTLLLARLQVREVADIAAGRVAYDPLIRGQLQRLFVARLAALNADGRLRVLTEPDLAGPLYHFGGMSGVESFYWENRDGMAAATAFFSDPGDAEARAVARERGLTHVILPHTPEMAHLFTFMREGRFSEEGARKAMAGRLVSKPDKLPPWIHKDEELARRIRPEYDFRGRRAAGAIDVFRLDPP